MKMLRVPRELRFVRAFALAVDPGDTLSPLIEIGAVDASDIGIVRHAREALALAYNHAGDLKDWDQAHAVSVLREALARPDAAAFLAYRVRAGSRPVSSTEYAKALAIAGCAADTLGCRRRPWEILPDALSLPEWRQRVAKLLSAMHAGTPAGGTALDSLAGPGRMCSEPGNPACLAGEETYSCASCHDESRP